MLDRWRPRLEHLVPASEIVAAAAGGTSGPAFARLRFPLVPDLQVLDAIAVEPELRDGLARSGIGSCERILDAGCGAGLVTRMLAELGAGQVTGVDAEPAMLDFARSLAAPARGAVRYQTLDVADRLPFDDGSFDAVFMGDLWMSEPFTEMRRVTRPGGRVVVKLSGLLPSLMYVWDKEFDLRMQQAMIAGLRRRAGEAVFGDGSAWMQGHRLSGVGPWRSFATFTVLVERLHPVPPEFEEAQRQLFARYLGPAARDVVDDDDWRKLAALWDPASDEYLFRRRGGHFAHSLTFHVGELPR
jgi:SAM-dependent methyltransferase